MKKEISGHQMAKQIGSPYIYAKAIKVTNNALAGFGIKPDQRSKTASGHKLRGTVVIPGMRPVNMVSWSLTVPRTQDGQLGLSILLPFALHSETLAYRIAALNRDLPSGEFIIDGKAIKHVASIPATTDKSAVLELLRGSFSTVATYTTNVFEAV